MAKVLLVAHWDWVLYNFRLPLAKALRERGYEVVFICPSGEHVAKIQAADFRWVRWPVVRRNINPARELMAIWHIANIYRIENPDLVHHFTIKPNLYGSLAAILVRKMTNHPLKVFNTFTGLGFLFSGHPTARFLRSIILPMLRAVLHAPDVWSVFQNFQDKETFLKYYLAPPERMSVIVSSGVDVFRFHPSGQSNSHAYSAPIILMASRLLWDKGVKEFVEAARLLRRKGIPVQFWLAGAPDDGNPMCVPESTVRQWHQEGLIRWLGHRDDLDSLLRKANVAVLPSHHEGVPRFLLEAAATGLPLVATDIEGCRLIVRHEVNGFLVQVHDPISLAEAIERLATDPDLRLRMGKASRQIAVREFDEQKILAQWLELYEQVLGV